MGDIGVGEVEDAGGAPTSAGRLAHLLAGLTPHEDSPESTWWEAGEGL